jgi:AraC-like DNA-binding protein
MMKTHLQEVIPFETPPLFLDLIHDEKSYHFSPIRAGELNFKLKKPTSMKRRVTEHKHDVYHIILYNSGFDYFSLNGVEHRIESGLLAISTPLESHFYSPINKTEVSYLELAFSLKNNQRSLDLSFSKLMSLYTGILLPDIEFPMQLNQTQEETISEIIRNIANHLYNREEYCALFVYRLIFEMFMFLAQELYISARKSELKSFSPLTLAKMRIERCYSERLFVDELASSVNLSPNYFHRAFKKKFHISPIAYQHEKRIEVAKSLLLHSDLLCKQIAAEIGFSDEFFFSKIFKKITGLSPLQYRGSLK